jgi:hypothetical protein
MRVQASMLLLVFAVSACAGTSTGVRSPCFARGSANSPYGPESGVVVSTRSPAIDVAGAGAERSHGDEDGCDFVDF